MSPSKIVADSFLITMKLSEKWTQFPAKALMNSEKVSVFSSE